MKKYLISLGIILLSIFIYYAGVGYLIKISIIISSLLVHILTHNVISKMKMTKVEGLNKLIDFFSPNFVNLLIGSIFICQENVFLNYMGIVNITICVINLIPTYPFDGRGVLDVIIERIESSGVREKVYKVVDKIVLTTLFTAALLQLVLFSSHFSLMLLYIMVKLFNKRQDEEVYYN